MRSAANHSAVWNGKILRKTKNGLRAFLTATERKKELALFHETLGHWAAKTTLGFLSDTHWWPGMASDAYTFVQSCDACERMKGALH